jgi:tripartite-type tricarboxylate transporter receptor subunit TctC
MTHLLRALAAVLCLILSVPAAWAQGYPSKPVRIVIPWAPGGGNDIIGRYLGEKLSQAIGQPVVIDNRAGQSGVIGADHVAKSAPDGYTIMIHSVTSHNSNASVFPKLPYDTVKDFKPIVLIASVPHVIVVNPSLPVHTARELVDHAKANPGKLSYASFGTGSSSHLTGELFSLLTGIKMVHVPYKGSGPALMDTMAGHVPVYFSTVAGAIEQVRNGKLRALAVTGDTRSQQVPQLPTVDEAVGTKGFVSEAVYGVYAPAGLPKEIAEQLNAEFRKILAMSDVKDKLLSLGTDGPIGGSISEMATYIDGDIKKWAKVIREANIKPD